MVAPYIIEARTALFNLRNPEKGHPCLRESRPVKQTAAGGGGTATPGAEKNERDLSGCVALFIGDNMTTKPKALLCRPDEAIRLYPDSDFAKKYRRGFF